MLLAKFSSIDTEIFNYVATSVTHVEKHVSLTNLLFKLTWALFPPYALVHK